jgi:hypothetical protein
VMRTSPTCQRSGSFMVISGEFRSRNPARAHLIARRARRRCEEPIPKRPLHTK